MNRELRRLLWSLYGHLDKAVALMHHAYHDPEDPPPEPFCRSRASSDSPSDNQGPETWHAVSGDDDRSSLSSSSSCYCGEKPPWRTYDPLTIHASSTVEARGGYVTIRDYVVAAHPWLQGLRELILTALSPHVTGDDDMPPDAPLVAMATVFFGTSTCFRCRSGSNTADTVRSRNTAPPPRRYVPRPRPPSSPFVPVDGVDFVMVGRN